jgi:hypothetical protein
VAAENLFVKVSVGAFRNFTPTFPLLEQVRKGKVSDSTEIDPIFLVAAFYISGRGSLNGKRH